MGGDELGGFGTLYSILSLHKMRAASCSAVVSFPHGTSNVFLNRTSTAPTNLVGAFGNVACRDR